MGEGIITNINIPSWNKYQDKNKKEVIKIFIIFFFNKIFSLVFLYRYCFFY